jgi:rfaE bifunctional protein kinase chain/domain/rfaE bifunctional protein nucleotidyltransferase chain/domain
MINNKLVSLEDFKLLKKKIKKKKIVLCHGVFDLLHHGHIDYLESAKKFGDILVVSVTSDRFVNKGPGRPYFNEKKRIKILASLEIVNYVILSDFLTSENVIKVVQPSFYAKGPDYKKNKNDITKNIYKENIAVKKFKGKLIYTSGEVNSSSNLINNFFTKENKQQYDFKKIIQNKYSFKFIESQIEKISSTRAVAIGETIIDEYIFSESIGKSGKEPHLVIKELYTEKYLGGIVAIGKHIENFCKTVNIITVIGDKDSSLKYIKKKLSSVIKFNFVIKKNSPTILKKRIVDKLTNQKLLGIYSINDRDLNKIELKSLNKILSKKKISKNDLVIISDYGHGFINENLVKKLCKKFKNIYLNAQLNASNIGYHSLIGYNNFNTLVVNESELRHEFKDKSSSIDVLIKRYSKLTNLKNIVVTRGANGVTYFNKVSNKFIRCPAFANQVIDKVGAGDTFLAIFAVCDYNKFEPELSLFIASLAAASSVATLGNSNHIDKNLMLKSIQYFLK